MPKLFFLILLIALLPVLVSGAFLEIIFTEEEDDIGFSDSSQLSWFFEGKEFNLALNLDSPDLSKEYVVDFGLGDLFVFDGNFSSTGFLFHGFVPSTQTFRVEDLSGPCDFFLLANVTGQSNFSRTVLKEQSFPVSVLRDESVFLTVDGDDFGSCRLRLVSGDGLKVLNFSVNFKLVPDAYEIILPHLRTCAEAPNDKCFRVGGVEYNYSELVERRGCSPETFLGGSEVEGGPPRACDEEEKQRLKDEGEEKDKTILELESKQVPAAVEAIEGVEAELRKLQSDSNALAVKQKEDTDSFNILALFGVVGIVFLVAYKSFRKPPGTVRGGLRQTGGGVMPNRTLSSFAENIKANSVLTSLREGLFKKQDKKVETVFEEVKPKSLEKIIPEVEEKIERIDFDLDGVMEDFVQEQEVVERKAYVSELDEAAENLFERGLIGEKKEKE